MSVNDLVGRVLDEISRLGEDGRTLAIFTSDNGYMWGEHRIVDKRFPYTESEAVPLLVRWPDHVTPGTVDDRLVSNVDIMPTLLEAAGVSPQLRYPLDGALAVLADTADRAAARVRTHSRRAAAALGIGADDDQPVHRVVHQGHRSAHRSGSSTCSGRTRTSS